MASQQLFLPSNCCETTAERDPYSLYPPLYFGCVRMPLKLEGVIGRCDGGSTLFAKYY